MPFVPGSSKNGVNYIPRDLDRAIAYAMLPGIESFLFLRARELSGICERPQRLRRPLPFKLQVAELSREIGVPKRSVRLALRRIEHRRILLPHGLGLHTVNQDWKTWLALDGSNLFSFDQVVSIQSN